MTRKLVAENTDGIAIIDDVDADLMQVGWSQNRRGHFIRNVRGDIVLLHRVIAERTGLNLSNYIDHKDRNPTNNRRSNLRAATNRQNQFNTTQQVNNTSGYKGVTWCKHSKRWLARIRFEGGRKYLGSSRRLKTAAMLIMKQQKNYTVTLPS